MPKLRGFTPKQRLESSIDRRREQIRRGLYGYMGMRGLTYKELGAEVGMSHVTASKLLKGERVQLTCEQWLRIVSLAGLAVVREDEAE